MKMIPLRGRLASMSLGLVLLALPGTMTAQPSYGFPPQGGSQPYGWMQPPNIPGGMPTSGTMPPAPQTQAPMPQPGMYPQSQGTAPQPPNFYPQPPAPMNQAPGGYPQAGPSPWSYPQTQPPAQPGGGYPGANPWGYNYSYSYGRTQPAPQPQGGQTYPGQSQPMLAGSPSIRAETSLSTPQPYVQESVILTLRVLSSDNLKTVDVGLPKSDAVVINKLDGPSTSVLTRGGKSEIQNELHYLLIPLRSGRLHLEPMHVTGSFIQSGSGYGGNREFNIATDRGLDLDVKPAAPGVQPWLPLQHLALRTELQGVPKVEAGQPFTLTVELTAVGAGGAQLPSLESQLQTPDFRVYREKSRTSAELTPDGRYLNGVRRDSFTLVPQYGGDLKLPELRVAWWNVNTGTLLHASAPTQPLVSSGGLRGKGLLGLTKTSAFFPAGSPAVFWVPLAAALGLILGYWLATSLRGKTREATTSRISRLPPSLVRLWLFLFQVSRPLHPLLRVFARPFAALGHQLQPVVAVIGEELKRWSLRPYWRRFTQALVFALPGSLRCWYSLGSIDKNAGPETWTSSLQQIAHRHLGLPPQSPLADIAPVLAASQPVGRREPLLQLLRNLDGALYGRESLDFQRWKLEFRRLYRPCLSSTATRDRQRAEDVLPSLNPQLPTLPEMARA